MRRLRLGLMGVAALVALGAGVARGQGIVGGADLKFTEVPLLDCDGTPCVEVRIGGGAPIKMGIDTGDAASVLDSRVAQAAGLKTVGDDADRRASRDVPHHKLPRCTLAT